MTVTKMALYPVLLAVLVDCFVGPVVGVWDAPNITWPKEYHMKGESIYVTAGILEPFEIWYSNANRRARKDVYGGTVKNYFQFSGIYEKNYVIHPTADTDLSVTTACYYTMKKRKSKKPSKKPYHFLPELDEFEYKGTDVIESKHVTEWEWIQNDDEKKLRRHHQLYITKVGEANAPVRYTVKSFDAEKQGLTSHVITNYYNFVNDVAGRDVNVWKSGINVRQCVGRMIRYPEVLDDEIAIDLNTSFHGYKQQHGKIYLNDEHETRKDIFKNNVKHIINHNRQGHSFNLAVNQFADRSDDEIQEMSCLLPSQRSEDHSLFSGRMENLEALAEDLPVELDMRILGAVTPVKNQLGCGSCWAFATTAAVEVALALRNGGRAMDLSEQSLVDCAWDFGNFGCSGGHLEPALKYVYAHGIPTEKDYGLYLMEDGICHLGNVSDSEIHRIVGLGRVPPLSEPAFKAAINRHGALTVGIHASKNLIFYSEGVYYDIECAGNSMNHAVTVVGYGERDGGTYWIVKNSWGTNWGEEGYVLLSAKDNNCGLMDFGYYAVV